ncbi:uncharacterized protein LOC131930791 [Physella acuta]|uniref:uncharacterized protein LOC131930791 n=1 Tax=Physella acuta TaxID=109671 RepID=UPI0027DD8EC9|nr:uncharacterized protein LOC131930791 [Physella acuta]
MCDTHFLNNFGDTVVVTVSAKTPTSIVVDNNMTRTELMLELSNAIFENQELREANRNLTEEKLTLLFYIFHEPVRGHFSGGSSSYYMSKFQSPSDEKAAEVCRSGLGGYLLEINSLEEYLMIQVRGANDKSLENKWINGHSNTRVTYFDWGPDQPHGGLAKNCLALWHSETDGIKMADIPCSMNPEAYTTYFICEKDAIVR